MGGICSSRYKAEGGPDGQVVNTKRSAIRGKHECWKSTREEKKEQCKENILVEHLGKHKSSNFCNFENHTSTPAKKERLSVLTKARIKTSRIKPVKKSIVPNKVKCLGKIDSSENQVYFKASVPFKRVKSANLRNYVRRIRSSNSAVRKKCPAVFGNFFTLLKFLQFC